MELIDALTEIVELSDGASDIAVQLILSADDAAVLAVKDIAVQALVSLAQLPLSFVVGGVAVATLVGFLTFVFIRNLDNDCDIDFLTFLARAKYATSIISRRGAT